jgi:hypothetical protein
VELLQRGFLTGSILTVDAPDALRLGDPWTRRYIYNQSHCGECGGRARSWPDKNKRTIYACEVCQPLRLGMERGQELSSEDAVVTGSKRRRTTARPSNGQAPQGAAVVFDGGGYEKIEAITPVKKRAVAISADRLSAMKAAKPVQVFVSHCAPDHPLAHTQNGGGNGVVGGGLPPPAKMTVKQLRAELRELQAVLRGQGKSSAAKALVLSGKRAELVGRLERARATTKTSGTETTVATATATTTTRRRSEDPTSDAATATAAAAPAATAYRYDTEHPVPVPGGTQHLLRAPRVHAHAVGAAATGAAAAAAAAAATGGGRVPTPATHRYTAMASAADAVREKQLAGENRGVEHIALEDDDSRALILAHAQGGAHTQAQAQRAMMQRGSFSSGGVESKEEGDRDEGEDENAQLKTPQRSGKKKESYSTERRPERPSKKRRSKGGANGGQSPPNFVHTDDAYPRAKASLHASMGLRAHANLEKKEKEKEKESNTPPTPTQKQRPRKLDVRAFF